VLLVRHVRGRAVGEPGDVLVRPDHSHWVAHEGVVRPARLPRPGTRG
jgi:hypothetical protein